MSFLTKLFSSLLPMAFDWVLTQVVLFFKYFLELAELKKHLTAREKQAAIVESISAQIHALLQAGEPVPLELKERLREESRKLHKLTVLN